MKGGHFSNSKYSLQHLTISRTFLGSWEFKKCHHNLVFFQIPKSNKQIQKEEILIFTNSNIRDLLQNIAKIPEDTLGQGALQQKYSHNLFHLNSQNKQIISFKNRNFWRVDITGSKSNVCHNLLIPVLTCVKYPFKVSQKSWKAP